MDEIEFIQGYDPVSARVRDLVQLGLTKKEILNEDARSAEIIHEAMQLVLSDLKTYLAEPPPPTKPEVIPFPGGKHE